MPTVEVSIIQKEEILVLVQMITRREQITLFIVHETMVHLIVMEQASEILS